MSKEEEIKELIDKLIEYKALAAELAAVMSDKETDARKLEKEIDLLFATALGEKFRTRAISYNIFSIDREDMKKFLDTLDSIINILLAEKGGR